MLVHVSEASNHTPFTCMLELGRVHNANEGNFESSAKRKGSVGVHRV